MRREPFVSAVARRVDASPYGLRVERRFADFGAKAEDLRIHADCSLKSPSLILSAIVMATTSICQRRQWHSV
jgi:hypothetical protein